MVWVNVKDVSYSVCIVIRRFCIQRQKGVVPMRGHAKGGGELRNESCARDGSLAGPKNGIESGV